VSQFKGSNFNTFKKLQLTRSKVTFQSHISNLVVILNYVKLSLKVDCSTEEKRDIQAAFISKFLAVYSKIYSVMTFATKKDIFCPKQISTKFANTQLYYMNNFWKRKLRPNRTNVQGAHRKPFISLRKTWV
jgi:hypothetical protein